MFGDGHGVFQDHTAAAKWYLLAALQGDASAQYNLALMYYDGYGVSQDYTAAYMWAYIAIADGFSDGEAARDTFAEQMTQADIVTAQKMANECLASNYKNCGN